MQTATLNSFSCCERADRERPSDSRNERPDFGGPTVCPDCKALFRCGRWQWTCNLPYDAQEQVCQACRRIHDGCPAGIVRLQGDFVRDHKPEIIQLIYRQEQRERRSHPMRRIIAIKDQPNELLIQTTDVHLPRRIASAVRHAHKGELEVARADNAGLFQINWTR